MRPNRVGKDLACAKEECATPCQQERVPFLLALLSQLSTVIAETSLLYPLSDQVHSTGETFAQNHICLSMCPMFRGFPKAVGTDLNRLFLDGVWECSVENNCPKSKLIPLCVPGPRFLILLIC